MSAKRHFTISCDGPECDEAVPTNAAFVDAARAIARADGWWKLGESREGGLDFCTQRCENAYYATGYGTCENCGSQGAKVEPCPCAVEGCKLVVCRSCVRAVRRARADENA